MTQNTSQDLPAPKKTGRVLNINQQFPSDQFNKLTPTDTIMEISPLQRVTLEMVTISADPNDGEIYKVGTKQVRGKWEDQYALAKPTLDRIAHALGISWIPSDTKRIDDRSDPKRVEYRAVGVYKQTDGTIKTIVGDKEIDLEAIEDETRFALEEKAMNGRFYVNKKKYEYGTDECEKMIDFQTRKAMLVKKKFKLALAESGAKNRAIRSMGLQSTYTIDELKKPFVVPRVDFDPNILMSDPTMKKALMENAMSSAQQLYGSTPRFYSNGDDAIVDTPSTTAIEDKKIPEPSEADWSQMNDDNPLFGEAEKAESDTEADSPAERAGVKTEDMITDKQRKAIFAQARKYWGDKDDKELHKAIKTRYDVESVNDLTEKQAKAVVSGLTKSIMDQNRTFEELIQTACDTWQLSPPEAINELNKIVKKRYRIQTIDKLEIDQIGLLIKRIEEGKDIPEPKQPEYDDEELPF